MLHSLDLDRTVKATVAKVDVVPAIGVASTDVRTDGFQKLLGTARISLHASVNLLAPQLQVPREGFIDLGPFPKHPLEVRGPCAVVRRFLQRVQLRGTWPGALPHQLWSIARVSCGAQDQVPEARPELTSRLTAHASSKCREESHRHWIHSSASTKRHHGTNIRLRQTLGRIRLPSSRTAPYDGRATREHAVVCGQGRCYALQGSFFSAASPAGRPMATNPGLPNRGYTRTL